MKVPWRIKVFIIFGLIGTICIIIWLFQLWVLDGYPGFFSEPRLVGSIETIKQRILISPFGVIGLIFVITASISAKFHYEKPKKGGRNETNF